MSEGLYGRYPGENSADFVERFALGLEAEEDGWGDPSLALEEVTE